MPFLKNINRLQLIMVFNKNKKTVLFITSILFSEQTLSLKITELSQINSETDDSQNLLETAMGSSLD